jgi:undecaprenyl diphosphate synthase
VNLPSQSVEPTPEQTVTPEPRPKHIAIIMDGNGRWAQQQGLPRIEGHLRGVESVRRIMEACRDLGVEVLTLYCLSSENWKRPARELEFLMALLREYLIAERETLVKNNLRLKIIGRRERLPAEVQSEMDRTIEACSSNTGMTLCLAINYGARSELVDSFRVLADRVRAGTLKIDEITEDSIDETLYTAGLPDPDLLIRTSGEMRISNFLLWQISYSEIWVTDVAWPEFDRPNLEEAIREFSSRKRRFGGLNA